MDSTFLSALDLYLEKRINELVKRAIQEYLKSENVTQDDLMNTAEAAAFLKTTTGALYNYTHLRIIPYTKVGRRNMFSRKLLLEWIYTRKNKTIQEIESESLEDQSKKPTRKK